MRSPARWSIAAKATPREAYYIVILDHMISFSFDSAAAVTDELIRNYPDDKEAYLQRGQLFEIARDYEQAIRMYHRASQLDSGYAQAIMSLGYAYSSVGEQQKALAYMKRYVMLAPEAGDSRASYADLLVRMGHYQEALEQYRKSLEVQPDYWYSMQQIGRVYATLGRLRESEAFMQQAIALFPPTVNKDVPSLVTRAGLDMYRGKYREAADQYLEALSIDSLSGGAAYGLCRAFLRLKEPALAREVLAGIHAEMGRRNLLESPAMLDYYLLRSRIALAEKNLDAARADCDTALVHATLLTRPYIYRQIAEINISAKDFQSALSACEEALAPNPNEPSMLLTLTRVYHAMGDIRMTREIGSRLSAFWSDADPDFILLSELRRLLVHPAAA